MSARFVQTSSTFVLPFSSSFTIYPLTSSTFAAASGSTSSITYFTVSTTFTFNPTTIEMEPALSSPTYWYVPNSNLMIIANNDDSYLFNTATGTFIGPNLGPSDVIYPQQFLGNGSILSVQQNGYWISGTSGSWFTPLTISSVYGGDHYLFILEFNSSILTQVQYSTSTFSTVTIAGNYAQQSIFIANAFPASATSVYLTLCTLHYTTCFVDMGGATAPEAMQIPDGGSNTLQGVFTNFTAGVISFVNIDDLTIYTYNFPDLTTVSNTTIQVDIVDLESDYETNFIQLNHFVSAFFFTPISGEGDTIITIVRDFNWTIAYNFTVPIPTITAVYLLGFPTSNGVAVGVTYTANSQTYFTIVGTGGCSLPQYSFYGSVIVQQYNSSTLAITSTNGNPNPQTVYLNVPHTYIFNSTTCEFFNTAPPNTGGGSSSSSTWWIILIIVIVALLAIGIAWWYFKVHKPKQAIMANLRDTSGGIDMTTRSNASITNLGL